MWITILYSVTHHDTKHHTVWIPYSVNLPDFFVCLIWFFTSHQQFFSYKVTGLPELNQYLARINVLAQGHWVRLEPGAPRSRVKHSTTEPLPSLNHPDTIQCESSRYHTVLIIKIPYRVNHQINIQCELSWYHTVWIILIPYRMNHQDTIQCQEGQQPNNNTNPSLQVHKYLPSMPSWPFRFPSLEGSNLLITSKHLSFVTRCIWNKNLTIFFLHTNDVKIE